MIIDMHMHTDRHSECSKLPPEAMARTAVEQGLDGIVITEHDYFWSRNEVQELQDQFPELRILRGIEVSTEQGHALTYGVNQEDTAALYPKMPLAELTQLVHGVGGVVILAHPTRYKDDIPSEVYNAGIDGVEAASLNVRMYMERAIQSLASDLEIPCIAGTDAHAVESVGVYGTDFHAPINTERDLVRAFKTRAYSLHNNMDRITRYNATVSEEVKEVRRLQQEGTLSAGEIKSRYGFSYSFQKGVQRGKDMRLRVA
jgi:predicted metal-dependent phosphoesterase TrpH